MSNDLAIAAVTSTLQQLLSVNGILLNTRNTEVTTKPIDKVFGGSGSPTNQLNLFLYQIVPNAAWRNHDNHYQVRPGESGQPPLALNLHYLISATGEGDDEVLSHQWLGRAMRILNDHAILSREEINRAIIQTDGLTSDLANQVERVRITPLSLSLDDISKLWTSFTTPYRLSIAYEVSVVLIESIQPTRAPLPVLTRNITAQPNLRLPFPTLDKIEVPHSQGVVRTGDQTQGSGEAVTLIGYNLKIPAEGQVSVRLQHRQRQKTFRLSPSPSSSDTQLVFNLPDNPDSAAVTGDPYEDPNQWLIGTYMVTVEVTRDRQLPDGSTVPDTRTTNELPLLIAPRIIPPLNYNPADRTVTVTCRPRVLPGQRAVLLLGHQQLTTTPTTATDTLTFTFLEPPATGSYFVRLRVDGVDSVLVVQGDGNRLEFDPVQRVTIP